MEESQDFDNLESEEALTQLLTWAWYTSGPDVETVRTVANAAREYLWEEVPEERALLALGELCRYALCHEPYREHWLIWRDECQKDGLVEAYYHPDRDQEIGRDRCFAFDFAKGSPDYPPEQLLEGWEAWMSASRVDMRRGFLFAMQDFEPSYYSDEARSTPPMPDAQGPPECVTYLQEAIEACYAGIVDIVHGRDVDADALDDAADDIDVASDELQIILARVHKPIYAGMFCQALHDAFHYRLWDDVEDEESLQSWLEEWTNNCMLEHYGDLWNCRDISRGIPYFRKTVSLMAEFWPYADAYDDIYYPAKTAAGLTGLSSVTLNRLSQPGGPIRCKRPSGNRRLIHLGDLADHMLEQNPHI